MTKKDYYNTLLQSFKIIFQMTKINNTRECSCYCENLTHFIIFNKNTFLHLYLGYKVCEVGVLVSHVFECRHCDQSVCLLSSATKTESWTFTLQDRTAGLSNVVLIYCDKDIGPHIPTLEQIWSPFI